MAQPLDCALQGALDHLPDGWAWTREPASVLGKVLTPQAAEQVAFEAAAEAQLLEATPSTATPMLEDYERVLGPDPCLGPVVPSLDARRLSAHMRWTVRGGASRPHYVELAAALGHRITIEEFRPSRAGEMRAGQRLRGGRVRWSWRVHLPAGAEVVECFIRRQAPEHTVVVFAYDGLEAPI